MKLAFLVCNDFFVSRLMDLLHAAGIDYYTRWDNAKGKGRGTDPHLGTGSFGSTNAVLMIAFEDEKPLQKLIADIQKSNAETARKDDHVRLFQLPLERIV
jgi:hypothetical protein